MKYKYFLISGTAQERNHIAKEEEIHPHEIKIVNRYEDILGHRDGKIIFGYTGSTSDFDGILAYAATHGFEIP